MPPSNYILMIFPKNIAFQHIKIPQTKVITESDHFRKTTSFRLDSELNHNMLYMSSKKRHFQKSVFYMKNCCENPVDEMLIKAFFSIIAADEIY